MLKIYIHDLHVHRNETTFRPYIFAQKLFNDVGITFTYKFDSSVDMVWIGQASYMDKGVSLCESVDKGIREVEKFKGIDTLLFDGQDSGTLKGCWEVFKGSHALKLLKNTMYSDYTSPYNAAGRPYWDMHEIDQLPHFLESDEVNSERFNDDVVLSGTNWLSTIPRRYINRYDKDIDVFAMFQYPAKENWEWKIRTSDNYTRHRSRCITELKKIPNIKLVTAEQGKVSLAAYYELMSRSKIVIAPFGYGEIAPRDVESAYYSAVLIKPNMSHVKTIPNIYTDDNMKFCKWDYSDLEQHIQGCLRLSDEERINTSDNLFKAFKGVYTDENVVSHIHNLILNLNGYGTC